MAQMDAKTVYTFLFDPSPATSTCAFFYTCVYMYVLVTDGVVSFVSAALWFCITDKLDKCHIAMHSI